MFKSVSSQVSLPELEEKIIDFWKEDQTFQKSIDQRSGDNLFSFVDGPPFVSGLPHYGHLLTSIAKDVVPRFQTMLGKRVRRVWGWDCHGLPIEEKVNKIFGIRSNAELEKKLGVEKYVQACRKYVQSTTDEWRWYIEKIGRWVDMDNAYYTMDVKFMESVIWAFKQIYKRGLIYKGKRTSLFSTDTSTPVSNFEVAMDVSNYRDVEDLSVFVKYELEKVPDFLKVDDKVSLVIWTTTAWSIPANFAIAVNDKIKYVLVEYQDEYLIVAEARLKQVFKTKKVKIKNKFLGSELAGLKYKSIYDFFDTQNSQDFIVYLSDEVMVDEGTGLLHIAPAFGEVDFELGKKHQLSEERDIDDEGKMTVGPWKGIYLRKASPLIAEDLDKKGHLLRSENYIHRLPFYRGKNPLIYMAQESYFINIQKIKKRILELNKDINWIPSSLKYGRFAKTVEDSPDWCISRNRYWATIMPIWKSADGDEIVIGSLEELADLTDQITKQEIEGGHKYFFEGRPMDLHRDVCDKIVLTKNGKKYHRIPEVLDVWMDSGSVPFAEYHYPFEQKINFELAKPADFIIEYNPQVRAWFTVLMRISTMIFDEAAFKNAIGHGTIAGNDGRKMSKSFGNYPDPKMFMEKYGADALRLYMMSAPVMKGEDMNFSEEGIAENYKILLILLNSYKFFVDYALLDDWSCEKDGGNLGVLDRWILAELTDLCIKLKSALDKYEVPKAAGLIKKFINDFSTWYIRRSRDKVGPEADKNSRNTVLSVMYGVLVTFSKLAAPLIPFITEEIYKNLTGEESVHLADYPAGDKKLLDLKLLKDMEQVREVVEKGHGARKQAAIKLRQPLGKLIYVSQLKLSAEFEGVIQEELNVKKVEYKKSADKQISVQLNTKITSQLKAEGEARDLIRQVQQMRKDNGLTLKDNIVIIAPSWPSEFKDLILSSTAAQDLQSGGELSIKKI